MLFLLEHVRVDDQGLRAYEKRRPETDRILGKDGFVVTIKSRGRRCKLLEGAVAVQLHQVLVNSIESIGIDSPRRLLGPKPVGVFAQTACQWLYDDAKTFLEGRFSSCLEKLARVVACVPMHAPLFESSAHNGGPQRFGDGIIGQLRRRRCRSGLWRLEMQQKQQHEKTDD